MCGETHPRVECSSASGSQNLSFFSDLELEDDLLCESLEISLSPSTVNALDKEVGNLTENLQEVYSLQEADRGNTSRFVIDHSVSHHLCQDRCDHVLGGCYVQLNSCQFYREFIWVR